jgi:peptide/nickel transport system substrate-binding protein
MGGSPRCGEFIPKIEQSPDLQTFLVDPLGAQGWLKPNWLHPPFNGKKARQALLYMMDQVTYLHWPIGQPQYYQPCYSVFACGGPYATTIGAKPMKEHGLSKARQLVEESGYDGRPIVVLHVTDSAAQRRGNRYPPTARVDRLRV